MALEPSTPQIIVNPNVLNEVEEAARADLDDFNAYEIEVVSEHQDKQKKAELNFDRIASFLDLQIDQGKIFLIPDDKRAQLQARGIQDDSSDGFYRPLGDYIVIFFSEIESRVSIEQKIVHELFHTTGLTTLVISQEKEGDNYTPTINPRRVGFALMDVTRNSAGNPSPGLLLEEMGAAYAGAAYLHAYADQEYWDQVRSIFRSRVVDDVIQKVGQKYVILNSHLQPMKLPSLFAFMFDKLRIKLGLKDGTPVQEVVRFAMQSRQNAESIRSFITILEQKLGSGAYSKLRNVDVSAKVVDTKALKDILALIEAV